MTQRINQIQTAFQQTIKRGDDSMIDTIIAQNEELNHLLEELQQRNREIEEINQELEETNRGTLPSTVSWKKRLLRSPKPRGKQNWQIRPRANSWPT
jgi:hypothetical protein